MAVCCLTSSVKYSVYIRREQIQHYHKITRWMNRTTGQTTTTWKSMYGELERDDNLVFESCYNSHTLYRNLSKRFETCKERGTLQTHWNLQGTCYSTNTLKPARSVLLYKHVETCKERGFLQTRHPLWSDVRFSIL